MARKRKRRPKRHRVSQPGTRRAWDALTKESGSKDALIFRTSGANYRRARGHVEPWAHVDILAKRKPGRMLLLQLAREKARLLQMPSKNAEIRRRIDELDRMGVVAGPNWESTYIRHEC
jgi:hypothetical protein